MVSALTSRSEETEDEREEQEAEASEAPSTRVALRQLDVEDDAGEVEDEDDDLIDEDPPEKEKLERVTKTVVRRGREKKPSRPKPRQEKETMAASKPRKPKEPTLDEIPREAVINLASGGYEQVRVDLRRQLPNGTWAGVKGNILVPPKALFDFQNVLRAFAGGGTYIFDVLDPSSKERIVPRWKDIIGGNPTQPPSDKTIIWDEQRGTLAIVDEGVAHGLTSQGPAADYQHLGGPTPFLQGALTSGAPNGGVRPSPDQIRNMAYAQGPQPQRDAAGNLMPPAPHLLPKWMHGLPPSVQWENVLKARVSDLEERVNKGDPTASQWVHHEIRRGGDLQSELASTRTELANLRAQMEDKIDQARREATAKVEAALEAKSRAERELEQTRADARYEALEAKMMAMNQKPGPDLVGLLTAAAPVLTAFMSTNSAKSETAQKRETEFMTTMLATVNQEKPSLWSPELITAVGTLAVPLLTKLLDSSGPQASAELMEIEHTQRMMQFKMLSELISSSVPEQSPWMPVIESAIQMLGSGAMMMKNRQLPAQPRGIGAGGGQPQGQDAPPDEQLEQMRQSDPEATRDIELIYQRVPPSLGFHTPEWRVILWNLHTKLDPEEFAETLVEQLLHNARFQRLPGPLENVFADPEGALRTTLGPLPIAQKDPEYVEAVIAATIREIESRDIQTEEDSVVDVSAASA